MIDVSVKEQDELEDWDVKELDGLNKVEKMLVKADEILEVKNDRVQPGVFDLSTVPRLRRIVPPVTH